MSLTKIGKFQNMLYHSRQKKKKKYCISKETHVYLSIYLSIYLSLDVVGCDQGGVLCHGGIQLILAYSCARPAKLVAGKRRRGVGDNFVSSVSSLSFLLLFVPCSSLSSPPISFLPFSGRQHKMTHKD